MKKIHPKMKALELSQPFSNYKSMAIFPDVQGQLTHKSQVELMVVLVTCVNKEPIKNDGARVVTRFSSLYNPMGAICCHGKVK